MKTERGRGKGDYAYGHGGGCVIYFSSTTAHGIEREERTSSQKPFSFLDPPSKRNKDGAY